MSTSDECATRDEALRDTASGDFRMGLFRASLRQRRVYSRPLDLLPALQVGLG